MKTVKREAFDQFADGHRKHQSDSIHAAGAMPKGQVSIPTGTGKTRIQVHLHLNDMLGKSAKGETGVYVIAAHRLILCRQLLMSLIDLVANCGLPFDVLFVGSDRIDEDAIYEKYMINDVSKKTTLVTATTRQEEIKSVADAAKIAGRHVLVVSTYHSIDHLRLLESIDVVTYDEAHTIASSRQSDDNFEAHVKEIQDLGIIKNEYFFTATRKVCGVDWGMNNKEIYGEILYETSPGLMIQAGEIVPPKIHRITTTDDGEFRNATMVVKTIMDAFSMHRHAVKTASPLSGRLGAKLLISAEGTPEVKEIVFNDDFQRWCIRNSIRLFVFSSLLGTYMIDSSFKFRKAPRNEVMDEMQALDDGQDAILLHIDILSEGIDLPSITGVLPFREMNLIKLLQTIGRAARLLGTDRTRLYKGEIKPMEWDKMVKPRCFIIFPKLDDKISESSQRMEKIIQQVLDAYDAPKMNFNREDEYVGEPDHTLDPIPPKDESGKPDPVTDLNHVLEDLCLHFELVTAEELALKLAAVSDPTLRL